MNIEAAAKQEGPKKRKPATVYHIAAVIGEFGRYMVESQSDKTEIYMVDLAANGGVGECTCPNWYFHCRERIGEGEDRKVREYLTQLGINPERNQCKHVFLAKHKFANDTFKAYAAENQKQ